MPSSKSETQRRVEETLRLILLGAALHDVREYAQSEDPAAGKAPWNVSDRQLRRYVRAAEALLAEAREKDRHKLLDRHLAQRRALYSRCMATGDYRTALAVARDEAELAGLYNLDLMERLDALEKSLAEMGVKPDGRHPAVRPRPAGAAGTNGQGAEPAADGDDDLL